MPLAKSKKITTKGLCYDPEIMHFPVGAKLIWRTYIVGCGRTGRRWELSGKEFIKIITSSCYYCGIASGNAIRHSNKWFKYNGIDRIDNAGDYEMGNVRPCCKVCNSMKSSLSEGEFFSHIERIHNYSGGELDGLDDVYVQGKLF